MSAETVPIPETTTEKPVPDRLSRRDFIASNLALFGAMALGEAVKEPNTLEVTRHAVPLSGLRAPLRVVQLTDLHRSWCVPESFIARIVERTNRLKPDLVLLTGDFVTRTAEYAKSCADCLAKLRSPLGLYGVLGNHDYSADNFRGWSEVAEYLSVTARVTMLINSSELLDNGLRLVGVDDALMGRPDCDLAFADVRPGEPVLTMSHNPILFRELQHRNCITLAGHTHGGQIRLPFVTRNLLTQQSEYLAGWFGGKCAPGRMYVSRGLGVVGIPLRFRAVPEIAVFDFRPT